jgi:hypothetical protein
MHPGRGAGLARFSHTISARRREEQTQTGANRENRGTERQPSPEAKRKIEIME